MICKIQRAIVSNRENPPCLVYNEERTFIKEFTFYNMEELFGEKFKIYVEAEMVFINHDFDFIIHKVIEDQDW